MPQNQNLEGKVNPFWDFIILKPKEKQKQKKKRRRPSRGSRWPAMGLSAMGLLSFSQAISISLLNDKKKEEEEWDERLSAGRRSGREEKIEGRRRNKKTI
jgi:hypothetical protein